MPTEAEWVVTMPLVNVLNKIKPNETEKINFKRTCNSFLQVLNSHLSQAKAILGGSGAKDTWLTENHDVDIFVLYNYQLFSKKSGQISNLLEKTLKKTFKKEKLTRVHGSRDYFQLSYHQFSFEVVPILAIATAAKAVNITDVSPLHARWVNAHARELKDEIRLAKQFCRAQDMYGAESYIGGFSGYVLEILVIFYGSFQKLLTASQQWKVNEVVDVAGHYAGKNALFEINSSKHSPLLVIDPVDKSRNAAAALTLEKFLLFKKKAQDYLQRRKDYFFEKELISLPNLKKMYPKHNIIYVEVKELNNKKDVVGSQLLQVFKFLQKGLAPFEVTASGWDWNIFYFIVKRDRLAASMERAGPPLKLKQAVANFKKKHRQTYLKRSRIYAKIPQATRSLEPFVKQVLADPYLQERISKIKICTVL